MAACVVAVLLLLAGATRAAADEDGARRFISALGDETVGMPEGDWQEYDDFPAACNISYATLNLAGPTPNLRPTMPVAYISDANPLFIGARFNPAIDADRANSPAHRGKGQTVLTLDGSTKWMTKPQYGPKRDNLWLIGGIRRYTGIETPTGDDVQLVPGYPATDPAVSRTLRLR